MAQAHLPVPFVNEAAGVRGFLHCPAAACGCAFVLTHGAGSNCQTPLLIAVASAFCEAGFTVLRCDLPFRQRRPHGPPAGMAAQSSDRKGLKQAVLELRKIAAGPLLLGGHSYGGRQSTMLAATENELAAGLLLLSYPLHPAKRPDQYRTEHFPTLRTPALFVHGTRDSMGSIEEMRTAISLIPAATQLASVEGAGHDLSILTKQEGARALPQYIQNIGQLVPGMEHHQTRVSAVQNELAR